MPGKGNKVENMFLHRVAYDKTFGLNGRAGILNYSCPYHFADPLYFFLLQVYFHP